MARPSAEIRAYEQPDLSWVSDILLCQNSAFLRESASLFEYPILLVRPILSRIAARSSFAAVDNASYAVHLPFCEQGLVIVLGGEHAPVLLDEAQTLHERLVEQLRQDGRQIVGDGRWGVRIGLALDDVKRSCSSDSLRSNPSDLSQNCRTFSRSTFCCLRSWPISRCSVTT